MNQLNNIYKSEYLGLFFRLILGYVFISAAIGKILNSADFSIAIQNYRILPEQLTNLPAIILPWIELYCGIFILLGIFFRASAVTLMFLTTVFILAISSAMIRGLDISCGCFDPADATDKIGISKIIEDIIYLTLALHCYFFPPIKLTMIRLFNK
jgi:putative oxidoreductase